MSILQDLLLLCFILYIAADILFFMVSMLHNPKMQPPAVVFFLMAGLVQTAAATLYSISAGRLPLASMFEFVLLLSLVLAWTFMALYRAMSQFHLGSVIGPLETACLAFLITRDIHIVPLLPALQSVWLHVHVALAIIAYGLFTLSFAAALLCLSGSHAEESSRTLESLMTKCVSVGFPFQTLVLITGAVWAEQAWGAWWSWDPKETWALVTWLVYALYLHASTTKDWDGRKAALMAVFGFATVLFTLFGVTFLLPGLHSYG